MSQRWIPVPPGATPILQVDARSGGETVTLDRITPGTAVTVRRVDSVAANTVTVAVPAGLLLDDALNGTTTVGPDSEKTFRRDDTGFQSTGSDTAGLATTASVMAAVAAQHTTDMGTYAGLAVQRQVPRPVASHADVMVRQTAASNSLSDGVSTGLTTQHSHVAGMACQAIRLVYRNVYNNNGALTDGPNDITVKAGVRQTGGLTWPVFFNGRRSAVCEPGAVLVSDPVPISLAKAATFFSRTYVSVTGGQKYPLGRLTDSTAEGYNTTDTVDTTITSGSARGYGPHLILGDPTIDTLSPIVTLLSDSIGAGYQDTWGAGTTDANGWGARAFDGVLSWANLSVSGIDVAGSDTINEVARRLRMLGPCKPAVIVSSLGINDLQNSASESAVRTRLTNMWTMLATLGVRQYALTITPQSTSTDSWATVGNQTTTSLNAARVAVNAWIRDGAPILSGIAVATGSSANGTLRAGSTGHPMVGYFEAADAVESARDSGLWKAGYTPDGTHPGAAGAAAIAAAVTPATIGVVLP